MKKLLVLLFSVMISFNSYGDWTDFGKTVDGTGWYINYDTIKKHNGYVYYWDLTDYIN
jgi:hypothetical protein